MRHLPEAKQNHWMYYLLTPGLAFDIYPEQRDFMQFIPISVTRIQTALPVSLQAIEFEMIESKTIEYETIELETGTVSSIN